MSAITTHVLDTVLGKPAAGVAVRLEKQAGGGWIEVSSSEPIERAQGSPCDWVELSAGVTDADGRCGNLEPNAEPGVYRLVFDTGEYFKRMGRTSIYSEITVTFTCSGEAHYHLPLLLSDNCYTIYRGS